MVICLHLIKNPIRILIKVCCICFPGAVSREIKEHFPLVSTIEKIETENWPRKNLKIGWSLLTGYIQFAIYRLIWGADLQYSTSLIVYLVNTNTVNYLKHWDHVRKSKAAKWMEAIAGQRDQQFWADPDVGMPIPECRCRTEQCSYLGTSIIQ